VPTLLLARHGETDWNRDRRWQGHSDPPLNETGRRQARDLAARMEHEQLEAVYSSDSRRARETAEIVGARLGLPVKSDARLREVSFGEWEGLTSDQIGRRYADAFARWEAGERPLRPGIEPDEAMAGRVLEALREIAEEHPDGRVLVVTSGGPLRAAEAHLQGIDQVSARRLLRTVDNCGLIELAVRDGVFAEPAR
jgi:broad specificity phosphatase PhoE